MTTISIHQIIALRYVYERLIKTTICKPTIIVPIIPILIWCIYNILYYYTGTSNNIIQTIIITIVVTIFTRRMIITKLATSTDALEKSLRYNYYRIPIIIFLIIGLLLRSMTMTTKYRYSYEEMSNNSNSNNNYNNFSLLISSMKVSIRIAFSMLLLGLIVLFRFIGPASFMRCSIYPLISNPFETSFLYLKKYKLLGLLEPSENFSGSSFVAINMNGITGGGGGGGNHNSLLLGRRYQRPVLRVWCAQLLLCSFLGLSSFYISVLPYYNYYNNYNSNNNTTTFERTVLQTAGIVSAFSTLLFVFSDYTSHEIILNRYLYLNDNLFHHMQYKIITYSLYVTFFTLITSFIIGILVVSDDQDINNNNVGVTWYLLIGTTVCSSFIQAAFLFTIEELAQISLFVPTIHLRDFITEVTGQDSARKTLDIVISTILGNSTLAGNVWEYNNDQDKNKNTTNTTTATATTYNISTNNRNKRINHGIVLPGQEGIEMTKVDGLGKDISSTFLRPVDVSTEAPLEEDVFRIVVLNALIIDNVGSVGTSFINELVDKGIVHYLVRCLCVFINGFGKVLINCATIKEHAKDKRSALQTWILAPTAVIVLELAINALTQCYISCSQQHNDVLIPQISAVLEALYTLHTGLEQFSQIVMNHLPVQQSTGQMIYTTNGSTSTTTTTISNVVSPQFWNLARTCQTSVVTIIDNSIKSTTSIQNKHIIIDRADSYLSRECRNWKDDIITKYNK